MKNFMKKFVVVVLAMAMLAICIPQKVEAATKGSLQNPANLGTGGSYKRTWARYDDGAYISFKMKKQGYATISASKIYNYRGTLIYYNYYL